MMETIALDPAEVSAEEYIYDNDWSDGLPVIVPTTDRVERFLEESGYDPVRNEVIGLVAPAGLPASVERIAVNAVLAGCRPEHLGVVIAAVEAMVKPEFQLADIQVTTNPATPMVIVSGSAAASAGVSAGGGALGPGQHANGPVGRAVRLIMRNIGGAVIGIDHATLGQPAKYTFCLAESEADSPWEPLRVSLGYQPADSAVIVAGVENVINVVPIWNRGHDLAPPFLRQFSRLMHTVGTNIFTSYGSPVLVISPGHARRLAEEGYGRQRLQRELFELGKVPVADMPFGNLDIAQWTTEGDDILITQKPEDILILVAGGNESLHSMYMQPFCLGHAVSALVRRP
jgi:hypothetical protein